MLWTKRNFNREFGLDMRLSLGWKGKGVLHARKSRMFTLNDVSPKPSSGCQDPLKHENVYQWPFFELFEVEESAVQ